MRRFLVLLAFLVGAAAGEGPLVGNVVSVDRATGQFVLHVHPGDSAEQGFADQTVTVAISSGADTADLFPGMLVRVWADGTPDEQGILQARRVTSAGGGAGFRGDRTGVRGRLSRGIFGGAGGRDGGRHGP